MAKVVAEPSAEHQAQKQEQQKTERRKQIAALRAKNGRSAADTNQLLNLLADELTQ